jgi:hypothetical protein
LNIIIILRSVKCKNLPGGFDAKIKYFIEIPEFNFNSGVPLMITLNALNTQKKLPLLSLGAAEEITIRTNPNPV